MKKNKFHLEWIEYAESDYAMAKLKRTSKKILYESLCFHCQQAAEKAIKAVFIFHSLSFPKTHDINMLLNLLSKHGIEIPKVILKSISLTHYAALSRYPGTEDKVDIKEFKAALKIAENTLNWAKTVTTSNKNKLF